MTAVILIGAPAAVVLGCLFWVLSFAKEQAKATAEIWKSHGVKV